MGVHKELLWTRFSPSPLEMTRSLASLPPTARTSQKRVYAGPWNVLARPVPTTSVKVPDGGGQGGGKSCQAPTNTIPILIFASEQKNGLRRLCAGSCCSCEPLRGRQSLAVAHHYEWRNAACRFMMRWPRTKNLKARGTRVINRQVVSLPLEYPANTRDGKPGGELPKDRVLLPTVSTKPLMPSSSINRPQNPAPAHEQCLVWRAARPLVLHPPWVDWNFGSRSTRRVTRQIYGEYKLAVSS